MAAQTATKVYLVYTEYQADTPSLEGVYRKEKDANVAAQVLIDAAVADNKTVYGVNDGDSADWDEDIHVEEMELQ